MVGPPTVENFKMMLKTNIIKNCPVTIEDVNIAERIYGKDIATLKGKNTRRTPNIIVNDEIEIPKELLEHNRELELCMDTMIVNGIPMITTIDKTI